MSTDQERGHLNRTEDPGLCHFLSGPDSTPNVEIDYAAGDRVS